MASRLSGVTGHDVPKLENEREVQKGDIKDNETGCAKIDVKEEKRANKILNKRVRLRKKQISTVRVIYMRRTVGTTVRKTYFRARRAINDIIHDLYGSQN